MAGSEEARLRRDWADRVRGNRAQVERIRSGPERADFYAPVSAHFVVDPRRSGDPVLDALLGLARPGETWLDIGAGAGRYALPLALAVGQVIALEPSPAMRDALRVEAGRHQIQNLRVVDGRWPESADGLDADVALIAHVGYDVEPIGPFLDAMEAAARRLCVAVLLTQSPARAADDFWPAVHGMERVRLPALAELVALLRARGSEPQVRELPAPERRFDNAAELLAYLRWQLWVTEGDPRNRRLEAELGRRARSGPDGISIDLGPERLGVVSWLPGRHASAL